MDFIRLRLRGVLQDEGIPYDILDAVINLDVSQLLLMSERAKALIAIKEQPYFEDLMVAFNRPFNLSRKERSQLVRPELFEDPAEQELYQVTLKLNQELPGYLNRRRYSAYCEKLALRGLTWIHSSRVMVEVEDDQIRENRLALLKQVVQMFLNFAILQTGGLKSFDII